MALTVTINRSAVKMLEGSLKTHGTIDNTSEPSFIVRDDTGTLSIQPGMPVVITDSVLGRQFVGYVNDAKYDNQSPNAMNFITVQTIGNKWLATRVHSLKDYTNQYDGDIASDLASNYLASSGVTASYAIRRDSTAAQLGQGTLTGVAATNNVGDGDLELSPAGTKVSFAQATQADFNSGTTGGGLSSPSTGGVTFTPTPAIKLQATCSVPGISGAYTYAEIWNKSVATYTIPSSFPTLFYDIWIADSCPQQMAGVEIVCTDGTSFLAQPGQWNADFQGVGPGLTNDLSGLATNTWYSRALPLYGFSSLGGKTIQYIAVAFGGSNQGTYTAYFRNVSIAQSDGVTNLLTVFGASATAIAITPQQLQNNGYSATTCAYVTSYERHGFMFSPFFSISNAGIVRSSIVQWAISLPAKCTFTITASIDGFATFLPCSNGSAIPGLVAGMNTSGKSVIFVYVFDNSGNDPTVTPLLSYVQGSVLPSYVCTKSDSITTTHTQAGWNAGTLANLTAPGGAVLQLNGVARNYDDANNSSETVYGTSSPASAILKKRETLTSGTTSTDAKIRFDFAGNTWQNFVAEIDTAVPAASGTQVGFVYRTTGWQNNNDTYAYTATFSSTSIQLVRGTNSSSGSGSSTTIASVAVTLTVGTIYHLKIVINGSNHQIWLNDVLYINASDSTYSAAGYIGYRLYNPTGSAQTATFDNFGIVASLSGTWVSPAIDIHSLSSISNSQIILQTDPAVNYSLVSFLVEVSLNNGSTWTTCPNNVATSTGYYQVLPVPGLTAGTNVSSMTQVKLRLTITATTASVGASGGQLLADLTAVSLFVVGAYSSGGFRLTPALPLDPVGTAGSALVVWNGLQPANTTIFVDTSIDNGVTFTNVGSGASGSAAIAGIVTQGTLIDDTFVTNTSSSYTATALNTPATWTFDTANSRVVATGGNNALLEYNGLSTSNMDVMVDLDEADNAGLVARVTGTSMYALILYDGSASTGTPNTFTLYAIVSGVFSSLATGSIVFVRGTPHRFHLVCSGTSISATMDGTTLCSVTDNHITSAGTAGLLAGSLARFYQFRAQPLGQNVVGIRVVVKIRLTNLGDPTVTPYITDLTLSVHNPDIQNTVLIPSTAYSLLAGNDKTLADCFNDLTKQSNNTTIWDIRDDLSFVLRGKTAAPSPWIVTSADFQLSPTPTAENVTDLYRNDQFGRGVVDTISFSKSFVGDGQTKTWTMDFPVQSLSSVTINGIAATIGVKGVDTGRDFYYQAGSNVISQDSSELAPISTQTVTFAGLAQVSLLVEMRNDAAIAALAAIDGTNGIIQATENCTGLSKAATITKLQGLLTQYALMPQNLNFTTMRSGLAAGQILTAFVPQYGIFDGQYLITDVVTTWRTTMANNVEVTQPFYAIQSTTGPVIGDYTRFLATIAKGAIGV